MSETMSRIVKIAESGVRRTADIEEWIQRGAAGLLLLMAGNHLRDSGLEINLELLSFFVLLGFIPLASGFIRFALDIGSIIGESLKKEVEQMVN